MIHPRQPIAPADVARHYDELDWIYRDIWGGHVHHGLWLEGTESPERAVRQLVERVATRAAIGPGSEVCDVGSGYGETARLLADELGARVTGITLSETQYRRAAGGAERCGVRFVLGDWLRNGFPDAAFDAVIAIESSEHMEDKDACFGEAFRVLRPGGRLAVAAWLAGEQARAWERRHLLAPICLEGRIPGLGTAAEYVALIERAGFGKVVHEDLSRHVRRTWTVCIARSLGRLWHDRRYRAFLRSPGNRNRDSFVALPRIWLAYETGALRYGLFSATRVATGGRERITCSASRA